MLFQQGCRRKDIVTMAKCCDVPRSMVKCYDVPRSMAKCYDVHRSMVKLFRNCQSHGGHARLCAHAFKPFKKSRNIKFLSTTHLCNPQQEYTSTRSN